MVEKEKYKEVKGELTKGKVPLLRKIKIKIYI